MFSQGCMSGSILSSLLPHFNLCFSSLLLPPSPPPPPPLPLSSWSFLFLLSFFHPSFHSFSASFSSFFLSPFPSSPRPPPVHAECPICTQASFPAEPASQTLSRPLAFLWQNAESSWGQVAAWVSLRTAAYNHVLGFATDAGFSFKQSTSRNFGSVFTRLP